MILDSIDLKQQLYVLRGDGGFSCLGFGVARDRMLLYLKRMGRTLPDPIPYGDREAFALYQSIEREYMAHPASRETTFDLHTPDAVARILEEARLRRRRLRIYYGDRETGRDWNSNSDILGYIGRSMGPIRVPLLLDRLSSSGGGAILTADIVKIQQADTKAVLWVHSAYHTLPMAVGPAVNTGYMEAVYRNGELHAQFRRKGEAAKFIDRMLDLRMR
jgi:hypothetical protein